MVKMNIHSELEDLQISKLNEFFLVADRIWRVECSVRQGLGNLKKPNPSCGGARFPAPTRNAKTPFTNGSFALSVQGSRKVPLVPNSSILRSLPSIEEKDEIQAPEDPAAFSDTTRWQLPTKFAQATSEKSDGERLEGQPQRSSPTSAHSDISAWATKRAAETVGRSSHT